MWLGFCVYGGGWVFCLMLAVCYLFIVMAGLFVYCDGWVFCLWQLLYFCVNGGDCVLCLNGGGGFFVYGGG